MYIYIFFFIVAGSCDVRGWRVTLRRGRWWNYWIRGRNLLRNGCQRELLLISPAGCPSNDLPSPQSCSISGSPPRQSKDQDRQAGNWFIFEKKKISDWSVIGVCGQTYLKRHYLFLYCNWSNFLITFEIVEIIFTFSLNLFWFWFFDGI